MSAGEGQKVVGLPAVSHNVLGPNPTLPAVRAEVDSVLGVSAKGGVVPNGDVDSVVGDWVECHRTSAASQLHTTRKNCFILKILIFHLITPGLGPICPKLNCRVFLPVVGLVTVKRILFFLSRLIITSSVPGERSPVVTKYSWSCCKAKLLSLWRLTGKNTACIVYCQAQTWHFLPTDPTLLHVVKFIS